MATTVHCDIVSAERSIFSGLVEMVVAHGVLGDLGVCPGHTPLLTQLHPGPVRVIKQGGEEDIFYVSGGFLEVQPNVVTVLADVAVRAHDVDEAAAQQAMDEGVGRVIVKGRSVSCCRGTRPAPLAAAARRCGRPRAEPPASTSSTCCRARSCRWTSRS